MASGRRRRSPTTGTRFKRDEPDEERHAVHGEGPVLSAEKVIRAAVRYVRDNPRAIVKAAIDGRLPRGFGVKRLMDLPIAWSDQWSVLGLKAPA